MDPGQAAGALFDIEINASGIDDLFGTGFTVVYDPTIATYKSCDSLGSILVAGGAPSSTCDDSPVGGAKFFAALQNGAPGFLNVRASLDGAGVPGLLGQSTGLLLTLRFEANVATAVPEPFFFEAGPSREVQACPQNLDSCAPVGAAFDGGTLVTSGG